MSAVRDTVLNNYLQTYQPSISRYDSHKKSDLRNTYNSIGTDCMTAVRAFFQKWQRRKEPSYSEKESAPPIPIMVLGGRRNRMPSSVCCKKSRRGVGG